MSAKCQYRTLSGLLLLGRRFLRWLKFKVGGSSNRLKDGAPRIHGELLKLGFDVAQSTVSKYMLLTSTAVDLPLD
jgi:hypothetical protein